MKKWIHAMRLRTLPLAASCILAGAAAAKAEGYSNWIVLVLTLCTTFLLQILSNFANDYGDFSHGVDNDNRVGPQRAMQSGAITQIQMRRALIYTTFLALISGISLLWVVFSPKSEFIQALFMLTLGIGAIVSAIRYTAGKNPYGYKGLGDVFVFIFFGPVGVLGTYFLLTGIIDTAVLLPASTIGFFSTAVLNLNNLRDHENDAASGKLTLVVQMGFVKGKIYQSALVVLGTLCLLLWLNLRGHGFYSWLSLVPAVIQCFLLIKVWRTQLPGLLDGELKKVAMLTFLCSLILFIF
ncbi:MAG: 1,4-dihydroxy-2-naphthoate octaprenyltransferase [Flavobacteriales bacterium]